MTANPYASLERAIAAAIAEIRSLRDQRVTLQARIGRLEGRLAGPYADADEAQSQPPGEVAPGTTAEPADRLQQLETEREAIRSRLLSLQARLGYLGRADPEERRDDHR